VSRKHRKQEVHNSGNHVNFKVLISSSYFTLSQVHTLLQAKMGQRGKQMTVGAREGFQYHSVETGFTV
jgi:hypothetical protein